MAKDIAKLLSDFKEEFRQEWKSLKVSLERDIRSDIREMKADIKSFKDSMNFMNLEFEDVKAKFVTVLKENAELKKENGNLSEKISQMENRLIGYQDRLTEAEQYSRNTNLEIKGVVKHDHEVLPDLVKKLGESIGEPIARSDIAICHRVPTQDATKTNIILQFVNRSKRDAVLDKAKKKRIKNSDLGLDTDAPVFVNEHLCPSLKRVLGKAIARKHQCNWKYIWVRNGKIFARQAERAPLVQITNEADVEKIC